MSFGNGLLATKKIQHPDGAILRSPAIGQARLKQGLSLQKPFHGCIPNTAMQAPIGLVKKLLKGK